MVEVGLGLVAMLTLIALGAPLAIALLSVAFVTFWSQAGLPFALTQFTDIPRNLLASYTFSVAPMFILMGQLAGDLGIASDGYLAFRRWLTFSRGGVLSATMGAGALFGAISGSTIAGASLFSKVALPELRKFNYDPSLSLACIAAAGTLSTLIPPSIMMVVFAMLTGTSVGGLLIAGVVPGVIMTGLTIALLEVMGRVNPRLMPVLKETVTWQERFSSLYAIWPIVVTFLLVMGGIYMGFFTPTAAGAVGAFIVFLLALQRRAKLATFLNSLKESVIVSSQIFFVVMAGMVFSKVTVLSGVMQDIIAAIGGFPPLAVVALVVLLYLILGALLDPVSMLAITLPFVFPLLKSLGFHELQIGIMAIILVQVAVLTPPVGFNCYVVASAANVQSSVVFRGIMPFILIMLLVVALVAFFPGVATWLPSKMLG